MTDAQAKKIAMQSARRGRKRARSLIVRVVSYFMDSYVAKGMVLTREGLDADVRKALIDPGHPARSHEAVDKFIEQILNDELLDPALRGRQHFSINF